MSKRLSQEQFRSYQQKGVVFPIKVLSPEEVAWFCAQFEKLEARLGGKPKAVQLSQTHLHFAWAYELSTHPGVLDAVEDILGPNIMVWTTSIFPKYERDPSYVSWHQDGTYWALDSTQLTSAWIALTDSTVANGCMRVVPGSHRFPIQPHVETYAQNNVLSRGQEIQVEIEESGALDVVLKAGEMSFHHVNIIHGSNPNRSDSKRIGFAVRFTTPKVNQMAEKPPVVLARGVDEYHHFPVLVSPPTASVEEGIAAHSKEARRLLESLRKTKPSF
ncbi:phytanoyl-CoA dioxygenase family protein [Acidobacteria bacterium AH-259-O06]|nr:phytanoyl-CoA dioxygenase family protein [Acidobacteria bacterium AH-259-O06]